MFEFVQFIYNTHTFSWKSHFTRSNRSQYLSTITALLALLLSSFSLLMLFFFTSFLLRFYIFTRPLALVFHRLLLNLTGYLWCFALSFAHHFAFEILSFSVALSFFIFENTHTRSHPNHPPSSNFHNVPMCHGTLCIWYASCAYVANESNVAEVMRYLTEKNYKTYK